MKNALLIVDDDSTVRRMLAKALKAEFGLQTHEAEHGKDALGILSKANDIKLIFLDLNMPVLDGHETLEHLMRDYKHIPVIVLTGSQDVGDAIAVMKKGAHDYLPKPIRHERLIVAARNALKISLMSQEITRLKRRQSDGVQFSDLIGFDTGLSDSVALGMRAASNDLPVLIMGDTGTGKEMFARAIHGESERADQPFIAVNCGAIPEKLVESTLFGHEKGAFSGAVSKAAGKFQEANRGTLFLDEIGELPLDAQVKLLRALQQKEIEPVGAGASVNVDVRVISATNRTLSDEVREGRFREDLFFRLNVLQIILPALNARTQDIEKLSAYFIELFCSSHAALPKALDPEALKRLQNYNWPGNVRELENVVNRTMALCDGDIIHAQDIMFSNPEGEARDLPDFCLKVLDAQGEFKCLKTIEQEVVAHALTFHKDNVTQAAKALGIAKSTLYAKMHTADTP